MTDSRQDTVISEIDPAERRGHAARRIRRGDRHDVILRLLAVDEFERRVPWQQEQCDPALYEHRWVRADEIEAELARHGYKSRALSTVISLGCRVHLEARWPGWTIGNDQRVMNGLRVSLYRIERTSASGDLLLAAVRDGADEESDHPHGRGATWEAREGARSEPGCACRSGTEEPSREHGSSRPPAEPGMLFDTGPATHWDYG